MSRVGYEAARRAADKDGAFLVIATTLSFLSTCDRKKVGALIVKNGRCISWGYNGAPPGLPHCNENDHGWSLVVGSYGSTSERMAAQHGCRNATHAELNAVAFAARQGISTEGSTLYVTLAPCSVCSRLLIAAGIVRVVFSEEYRDPEGLEILRRAGVSIG